MHKCTHAQMHKCTNAQMLKCTNAQMHHSLSLSSLLPFFSFLSFSFTTPSLVPGSSHRRKLNAKEILAEKQAELAAATARQQQPRSKAVPSLSSENRPRFAAETTSTATKKNEYAARRRRKQGRRTAHGSRNSVPNSTTSTATTSPVHLNSNHGSDSDVTKKRKKADAAARKRAALAAKSEMRKAGGRMMRGDNIGIGATHKQVVLGRACAGDFCKQPVRVLYNIGWYGTNKKRN